VVIYVDSLNSSLDLGLELKATNGNDLLAYSELGTGAGGLIVFTLPVTGTYYLHCYSADLTSSGRYNLATGLHVPGAGEKADRAPDHRAVYVKHTDGSGNWTGAPTRVNQEPGTFDDWLPEIAVAGNGKPYVSWYDFHDDPASRGVGFGSNLYLSRSDDGGAT